MRKGISPGVYKEHIIKALANISEDLQFEEFIFPWKGCTTTYRASNKITGKSKTYRVGNYRKDTFTAILTPKQMRMKQTGLAFGKDIQYTPVIASRDVTPVEGEQRIIELCKVYNHTFNGFVLPYTTFTNTKISLTNNETGKEIITKYKSLKMWKVRQNTRLIREAECKELCRQHGQIFLGFEYIDRNTSYIHAKCPIHDEEFTRAHRTVKYCNTFMCETCLQLLNSVRTGVISLHRIKELNAPQYIYIHSLEGKFIKFGITMSPNKRFGEIQRASKYKHEVIFMHKFKYAWQAADLEYGIKTKIKGKVARYNDVPDGWTETREYSKLPEVQKMIDDYIARNPTEPVYLEEINDVWGRDELTEDEMNEAFDDYLDGNFISDEEYNDGLAELDLSPLEAA